MLVKDLLFYDFGTRHRVRRCVFSSLDHHRYVIRTHTANDNLYTLTRSKPWSAHAAVVHYNLDLIELQALLFHYLGGNDAAG